MRDSDYGHAVGAIFKASGVGISKPLGEKVPKKKSTVDRNTRSNNSRSSTTQILLIQ